MLAEMPASAWWEWVAFSKLEPFGSEAAFLRAGIVASTIANANRNPKKRSRPYTPKDFMPKFGERPRVQSQEEQLRIVEMLNEAFGGQDLRQNRGRPN